MCACLISRSPIIPSGMERTSRTSGSLVVCSSPGCFDPNSRNQLNFFWSWDEWSFEVENLNLRWSESMISMISIFPVQPFFFVLSPDLCISPPTCSLRRWVSSAVAPPAWSLRRFLRFQLSTDFNPFTMDLVQFYHSLIIMEQDIILKTTETNI